MGVFKAEGETNCGNAATTLRAEQPPRETISYNEREIVSQTATKMGEIFIETVLQARIICIRECYHALQ